MGDVSSDVALNILHFEFIPFFNERFFCLLLLFINNVVVIVSSHLIHSFLDNLIFRKTFLFTSNFSIEFIFM
jgi:hypothetical protein